MIGSAAYVRGFTANTTVTHIAARFRAASIPYWNEL